MFALLLLAVMVGMADHTQAYVRLFTGIHESSKQYQDHLDEVNTMAAQLWRSEQIAREQAWQDLQAVPSYFERFADVEAPYPEQEMDELIELYRDLY